MRRLMANDIAYGVVLLAFVAAIVAFVYWPTPQRTVVHEETRTGPTLVIRTPLLTPLQARQAKRTSAARSPDSRSTSGVGGSPSANPNPSRSVQGLGKPTRPKARTGVPKRKTASRPPPQSAAAPSAPPAPPAKPLVTVTAPVPANACVKGVGGLNC